MPSLIDAIRPQLDAQFGRIVPLAPGEACR
jgi:hypothetical protein